MKKCHACGEPWVGSPGSPPGRNEACEKCGGDLYCCLNCKFYDPAVHHECLSHTAEYTRDKEKGNTCDEFQFSEKEKGGGADPGDMKKKWNDFFK
jgi:hypothetical protein